MRLMNITDRQFNRILYNWQIHDTVPSRNKLYMLYHYVAAKYDDINFIHTSKLYPDICKYLKDTCTAYINYQMQYCMNYYTPTGSILELYVKLNQRWQTTYKKITINDTKLANTYLLKTNVEIYSILNYSEHIEFSWISPSIFSTLMPSLVEKNITMKQLNAFIYPSISTQRTHYRFGCTLYHKKYILYRLFLLNQRTIHDTASIIFNYLIDLLKKYD